MMKAPAIVSALFATVAFAAVTPLTQMGSRNAETIKRDYSGSGERFRSSCQASLMSSHRHLLRDWPVRGSFPLH